MTAGLPPALAFEELSVDREQWLAVNAARAGRALANPEVRAALLGLITANDPEARQRRQRQRLAGELATMEWRWRYIDPEPGDRPALREDEGPAAEPAPDTENDF